MNSAAEFAWRSRQGSGGRRRDTSTPSTAPSATPRSGRARRPNTSAAPNSSGKRSYGWYSITRVVVEPSITRLGGPTCLSARSSEHTTSSVSGQARSARPARRRSSVVVLQPQRARVEEDEAPVDTETGSSAGSPSAERADPRVVPSSRCSAPASAPHHPAHGLDELLADDDDRGASPHAPLRASSRQCRCARERAEPLAEQQRQPERVEILEPQHHRDTDAPAGLYRQQPKQPEDRSTATRRPGGTRARSRQTAARTRDSSITRRPS